jgi:transposase
MKNSKSVFVGCDVGDKFTEIAVLDSAGVVVETARIRTTKAALEKQFGKCRAARIAIEVGAHSRWVAEVLERFGHEVIVANPRQVRLIWGRRHKTDRSDAVVLARLARFDVTLLAPIRHRARAAQVDLTAVRSRDVLVGARTKLMNHVRGTLKQFGISLPKNSGAAALVRNANEVLPPELASALGPVLAALATLNEHVQTHDKQVTELATRSYPHVARMTQIDGVGELSALTFALTVDDPHRFESSRFAGPFFGLTPGKDQSGDSDPQKRITKAGDPLVRRLLVQCAHHVLGRFGKDSDLRRWGLRLAERGGKNARKRAIVAVARKLAVLMHRLWLSGERYQPFGYAPTKPA